jgi:excinuclease ABC subunit C
VLVVDGGQGQLASAVAAVAELGLQGEVALCGLAKSRLRGVGQARRETGERLFVPGDAAPVPLPANAPETLLLAALRDEAHRFAITYHRQRRSRPASELDGVPGLGPTRRRALLRHFGSLQGLRSAARDQVRAVPGLPAAVAEAVFARLHPAARDKAPHK